MVRGTQENPIHKLRFDHVIGLRGGKVYYRELSGSWCYSASVYCFDNKIELVRVKAVDK